MSDTLASLQRKIGGAGDLESVVRSMKALAAASIGQYENSVLALADYYRTIELGLVVCLRKRRESASNRPERSGRTAKTVNAIVFGSDQGLVGQFNDLLADFADQSAGALPGEKKVWAVGDRVHSRLADAGFHAGGTFRRSDIRQRHHAACRADSRRKRSHHDNGEIVPLYLFHNRPESGAAYEPVQSTPAASG